MANVDDEVGCIMPQTTTEPYTFHPYELDGWFIHAMVGECFSVDTTIYKFSENKTRPYNQTFGDFFFCG